MLRDRRALGPFQSPSSPPPPTHVALLWGWFLLRSRSAMSDWMLALVASSSVSSSEGAANLQGPCQEKRGAEGLA